MTANSCAGHMVRRMAIFFALAAQHWSTGRVWRTIQIGRFSARVEVVVRTSARRQRKESVPMSAQCGPRHRSH